MEHLDPPEVAVWDERRLWFEEREAARSRAGAPAPGEQACALMIDLQAAFCAGAWTAAIVLAAAIVDAQVSPGADRRADLPGLARKELRWLRGLRNRLVHDDPGNPVITVEDHWLNRDTWERAARRAVAAALAALYPGGEADRAAGTSP
jgi:hypothetical protein